MIEPPAMVRKSSKAKGSFQLHRLVTRAQFPCVQCRRKKIAFQVATKHGDWAQTLCTRCYASLVQAERSKVRTAAAQEVVARREQQLQRRLPGVDSLLSFFRAAEVDIEVGTRGFVHIEGGQTLPLLRMVQPGETPDWNNVIDEVVLKYAGTKFIRAIADNAQFGEGFRAFLRKPERGFAIMRGEVRMGTIHPTHAHIASREVIYANFLKKGPHWRQVARVLREAEPDLMAEWRGQATQSKRTGVGNSARANEEGMRTPASRRFDELPSDLAPEVVAACLDASRRARLERQVAYERPVVLESDVSELTLLPIKSEIRLAVPFQLQKGSDTLKAELLLGDHDPLPLVVGEGVSDEATITAWVAALLGFADATCIDPHPGEAKARHEPAVPQWRPSSAASPSRPAARTLPRRQPWPRHLEPVGQWIRYSSSFVAGHRRRLSDGHTASDDAQDRARRVGIILGPHETWVQAHTRGVPDDIEMRFRWHAPSVFKVFDQRRSTN